MDHILFLQSSIYLPLVPQATLSKGGQVSVCVTDDNLGGRVLKVTLCAIPQIITYKPNFFEGPVKHRLTEMRLGSPRPESHSFQCVTKPELADWVLQLLKVLSGCAEAVGSIPVQDQPIKAYLDVSH